LKILGLKKNGLIENEELNLAVKRQWLATLTVTIETVSMVICGKTVNFGCS